MEIAIQPLQSPIEVVFEQYECPECHKKLYINLDDKKENTVNCLFCGSKSKSKRQFQISIIGIGEYGEE